MPPSTTLPTHLAGTALASAGGGTHSSVRLSRRTSQALATLEHEAIVAEACVTSRARLIGQATRASLRTSAAIWSEAELLAAMSPAAAEALSKIATASTVGLTNIVLDASA